MRALIISADGYEDSELTEPYYRLRQEGIATDIASFKRGSITGKHGHKVYANISLQEVDPAAYDLLILPGGKAPARLRRQQLVLEVARYFFKENKPVAAICHGPQILISAGVMEGRKATCYKSVADEMHKAGVNYINEEVVVDGNLITSRQPSDLPAFIREIMLSIKV